jgi:hypothetical protein
VWDQRDRRLPLGFERADLAGLFAREAVLAVGR